MNAFERKEQNEDMTSLDDKLAQVRSSCLVIKAKIAEMATMRNTWTAKVASGTYTQADIDAFNTYANATKLSALNTAVNTYLG